MSKEQQLIEFWQKLINRNLSILIIGKHERRESYKGKLIGIDHGFLQLQSMPSTTYPIELVGIRIDQVVGYWVLKDGQEHWCK